MSLSVPALGFASIPTPQWRVTGRESVPGTRAGVHASLSPEDIPRDHRPVCWFAGPTPEGQAGRAGPRVCIDAEHLEWILCRWSHNSCSRRQLGAAGILKTELSVSPHLLITPPPHPAVLRMKSQLPALAGGRPSPRPGPFSFCCASPYSAHKHSPLKSPNSPGDFVPVVPSTWDVFSRISA